MTQLKITNLSKKHVRNKTWPQEARLQAVSQYLVLGNMALVSATTGIPHQLLRAWKRQPWWQEMVDEVRATENIEMDSKLSKIVAKSLDQVLDRIENGEVLVDKKTGKTYRKPAALKDVTKVSVDLITKRELLRGNATERKETTQVSVDEHLKQLALEFAKWQTSKPKIETIDVEANEVDDDKMAQNQRASDQVWDDIESDGSGEMVEEDETGDSRIQENSGIDVQEGWGDSNLGQP